jgi:histidinol phosphatase-like enzyme (inositol monophosphatase family)
MSYLKELEEARAIAARAGALALQWAQKGVTAENKDDDSPVTIADKESEKLVAAALEQAFPEDGLLGEEGARKVSRSGRRWIIDPIDGTRDFVRGNGQWAVLIGLEIESKGEPVAGVCYFPAKGLMYSGAAGAGAYCGDIRLRASSIKARDQAVLCFGALADAYRFDFAPRLVDWMGGFWSVRSYGGAPNAMMVASGQADVWIEPVVKPWDLAPMKIILEEAGARFFNFNGHSSIHGGNCVGCAAGLEAEVKQFLGCV